MSHGIFVMPLEVPRFNVIHPIVVHFPIGIFLTIPFLLILAYILRPYRLGIFAAVAFLLLIGTGMSFLAKESGEARRKIIEKTPEIREIMHQHAELGERTPNIFAGLTVAFVLLMLGPKIIGVPQDKNTFIILHSIYFALYLAGCIVLLNTGHLGGQLTHYYRVRVKDAELPPGAMTDGPAEVSNTSAPLPAKIQPEARTTK